MPKHLRNKRARAHHKVPSLSTVVEVLDQHYITDSQRKYELSLRVKRMLEQHKNGLTTSQIVLMTALHGYSVEETVEAIESHEYHGDACDLGDGRWYWMRW